MTSFRLPALVGAIAVAAASQASAEYYVVDCETINGSVLLGSGPYLQAETVKVAIAGQFSWTVSLEAGDRLTVAAPTFGGPPPILPAGQRASLLPMGPTMNFDGKYVDLPFTYVADSAEEVSFGDMSAGFDLDNNASGLIGPSYMASSSISCTPAASADADADAGDGERLATAGTVSQNTSILNGLRGVRGRSTGGDVQVTQGTILGFQGDGASGWRVWAFTDFRRYSEAATGSSVGVTLGIDHDFGAARAGVVLSFDRTTLDGGAGEESVQALAIGPYVTGETDSFAYDAFVTYARPEYDLVGSSGTGERLAYGLAGEGKFDLGSAQLAPFVTVDGAVEEFAGETLRTQALAAGLRVNFGTVGSIDPYLSLAYQKTTQDSSISGLTEHSAPRFGLGFQSEMAHGAILGLDIDAGESLEDLRDVGLRLSYTLEF